MPAIDTEKFIEDIFNKPIIWNRNCGSNKSLTESTWNELSKKFGESVMTLKAKWKGLRDMFRVEIKRIPRNDAGELQMPPHEFESKWVHYKSLLFLADHMRSRNSKSLEGTQKLDVCDSYAYVSADYNINGADVQTVSIKQEASFDDSRKSQRQQKRNRTDSPIPEEHVVANLLQSPESQQNSKKRTQNPPNSQDLLTLTESSEIMNDDYHFLLSLQPFMSELTQIQKLKLRMDIQKLMYEELSANENQ